MQTEMIKGYFDVKEYNEKKPREMWKLKGEDAQIAFTTIFSEDLLPEYLAEFAKEYTNKDGDKCYRVTFKIGSKCAWFNPIGYAVDKPTNETLDGKLYECKIDFATLHAITEKGANGYWANGVQFRECQKMMFAPMDGVTEKETETETETEKDLPF